MSQQLSVLHNPTWKNYIAVFFPPSFHERYYPQYVRLTYTIQTEWHLFCSVEENWCLLSQAVNHSPSASQQRVDVLSNLRPAVLTYTRIIHLKLLLPPPIGKTLWLGRCCKWNTGLIITWSDFEAWNAIYGYGIDFQLGYKLMYFTLLAFGMTCLFNFSFFPPIQRTEYR